MPTNELYLAVLPMVHLGANQYGLTEQVITLFPSEIFATKFFPDEVDDYLNIFERRANQYLTTGHVTSYVFTKVMASDGRIMVKVTQNAA